MNAPSPESSSPPQRYKPKSIFYLYAFLFAIATIWLGSEAMKQHSVVWWIMFFGVGFITLRLILASFARAEWDGETLVYRTPLRKPHRIDRQQLALVEMGGRRNEALILGYHPRDDQGLIDTHRMIYVNMVPLEGQGELMDRLLAWLPEAPEPVDEDA